MSVPAFDYVDRAADAIIYAIGTSLDVATAMGRPSGAGAGADAPWVVPWNDPAVADGEALPILVYDFLDDSPWGATLSRSVRWRLTAFAADPATARALVRAAVASLTPARLAEGGVDACLDPHYPPSYPGVDHDPADDDPAQGRADADIALYLTP